VTINDLVITIAGTALRCFLVAQGLLPRESLVAEVPMSTWLGAPSLGNSTTGAIIQLHTEMDDIGSRLQTTHEQMAAAKHERAGSTSNPAIRSSFWPYLTRRFLYRLAAEYTQDRPRVNVIISNLKGPTNSISIEGANIRELIPLSAPMPGVAVCMDAMSYNSSLFFGMLVDHRCIDDVDMLVEYARDSLSELEELTM
jgi:diacylglycerol O-acyltransferase